MEFSPDVADTVCIILVWTLTSGLNTDIDRAGAALRCAIRTTASPCPSRKTTNFPMVATRVCTLFGCTMVLRLKTALKSTIRHLFGELFRKLPDVTRLVHVFFGHWSRFLAKTLAKVDVQGKTSRIFNRARAGMRD